MKSREENLQLIRTLKNLLKKHFGNNVQDVILFGSQSTGKATNLSDYDVLIILKNKYDWKYRDKITDVIYNMELQHEVLFDKHLLSLYEMKHTLKGIEPSDQNALKQEIHS